MPVKTQNPKYLDLATRLRADVQNGRLKPGDRLPSFVELRNEHRVSRGTVEKVHALLEKDGLIVREQGRGVFVAPTLRTAANGIIGFAGGGFTERSSSLFWAHLLDGIQQEAAEKELPLLLLTRNSDPSIWSKIDGLLMSVNDDETQILLEHMPAGLPCVSILHPVDEVSSVVVDDYQGTKDATDHLLALGHKRIGFLISGFDRLIDQRLSGYRDALQSAGIEPSLNGIRQMHLRIGRDSKTEFVEQGRRTMREWLGSNWGTLGYTALIAQNDNAAVGAIEALREAGLRVPEDVSVVGYDGNETYDYFTPRLTTVHVPIQEIGARAARMLIDGLHERGREPERATVPARLRLGGSTAPPPMKG
ncbi:arabinose metabolism transcriptional repressor [Capsulimonas corticalis]|uniref:Arabinose metabolism transcriptional repressor n=2 Tax=Capsulimonas corticalis TaxID=2219043 RepID=A0A9N7QEA4_9BACT|nr:arabinose metabolism transcriptional repressor [Capsulimonas corticalis]